MIVCLDLILHLGQVLVVVDGPLGGCEFDYTITFYEIPEHPRRLNN